MPDVNPSDSGTTSTSGEGSDSVDSKSTGAGTTSNTSPTGGSDTPSDGTTAASDPLTSTSPSSSSGDDDSTTASELDCREPRTLELTIADAVLIEPMSIAPYMGVDVASSAVQQMGAISFRVEIECPSNYRVFGYVRDDLAGTNSCCDPDSFGFRGPSGVMSRWVYGCGTSVGGLSWVQLTHSEPDELCSDADLVLLDLPVGEHELMLINREPASDQGSLAGIAALVVTNDPSYTP